MTQRARPQEPASLASPGRSLFLLNGLLLASLLMAWGILATHPHTCWIWSFHDWPPWQSLLVAGAALPLLLGPSHGKMRPLSLVLAGLLLLLFLLLTKVQPLGDFAAWRTQSHTTHLAASELLSGVVWRLVYLLFGAQGQNLVAPLVGLAVFFLFVHAAGKIGAGQGLASAGGLLILSSAFGLLFLRRYVENSQLAQPPLLLFILSLLRYQQAREQGPARRAAQKAGAWLGIAALFHGQNLFLLPALPLVGLWKPRQQRGRSPRDMAAAGLAFCATLALAVSLLLILGYSIQLGNIGLLEGKPFLLPLSPPPPGGLVRFGLFSWRHILETANILWLASPLLAVLPLVLLRRGGWSRIKAALQAQPVPLVLALAYVGFISLIHFSLGFPGDFDLMLGLSLPLQLYLLQLFGAAWQPGRLATMCLLLPGALAAWLLMASLVAEPWRPREHPLGEAGVGSVTVGSGESQPLLFVNGHNDVARLRPGERLVIELRDPPMGLPHPHFIVYGFAGWPGPKDRFPLPQARGTLAFPPPEERPEEPRLFLLTNNLDPQRPRGLWPSTHAPWDFIWHALPHELSTFTLQGVILWEPGHRLRVTNAVIVQLP